MVNSATLEPDDDVYEADYADENPEQASLEALADREAFAAEYVARFGVPAWRTDAEDSLARFERSQPDVAARANRVMDAARRRRQMTEVAA